MSAQSMNERVAKALYEAGMRCSSFVRYESFKVPWELADDEVRNGFRANARVVIATMREPIDKALDTRIALYHQKASRRDPLAEDDRNAHEAMKDHAMAIEYAKSEIAALFDASLAPSL